MQKKRNNRLRDFQTMGKKVLCGKFAQRLTNNFAVGDQDNNLLLYNIENNKPITVLNSNVSNVSAITALTFTQSDDQVIVGSNRGSMNVWDLNTLKISYCLKGHTIQICSFYADKRNSNLIASGSFDTNAKLWDLRIKNCIHTLKNHNKKVSAISISPDSRILVTGGQDGMIFTWDIKMTRPIFQYEVCSPIISLDVNEQNLMAAGCMDRAARVYDLNAPFTQIAKTKSDTMPISSCVFYKSNHLFTAGTDNLKVWDLTSDDLLMTDNIETSSKGILQMAITEKIQQIAYSSGVLSYHECFLSDVNFDGPYTYIPPQNNSIYGESQSPSLRDVVSRKGIMANNSVNHTNSGNKRSNSVQPNHSLALTNQKAKKVIDKKNQTLARQLAGINGNINQALNNIKSATQNFNNRKNEQLQLRNMMDEEHSKFLKVMGARAKTIQNILQLWTKGNIKVIIQHFANIDIYVASDVLSQILKPSNIQISSQFALVIAEKAKQMIKSKHVTLIKNGLQYMLHIVSLFKDEMIKLKTFGIDKGVDLARQERIRRFDMLIEQYVEVYQSNRLKKLVEKHDETSNLAGQLVNQLNTIFKKVFGNEYQF